MEDYLLASRVVMGASAVMISALAAITFMVVGHDVLSDGRRFAEAIHDFVWVASGLFAAVAVWLFVAQPGPCVRTACDRTVRAGSGLAGPGARDELIRGQLRIIQDGGTRPFFERRKERGADKQPSVLMKPHGPVPEI